MVKYRYPNPNKSELLILTPVQFWIVQVMMIGLQYKLKWRDLGAKRGCNNLYLSSDYA